MPTATAPSNERAESKPDTTPRVWLVSGYRAGERSQILALGDALGWPYEIKDIHHRKSAVRTNLFRGSDLSGVDLNRSSPLVPAWPDLVISAGLRNEPVCRWIRQQSGGKTLIVHIGKPWADTSRFDLVITTPQYRLPQRANVLHNALTLHRITPLRLAEAAQALKPKLGELPEPYIAVVVGGNSGPYTFGPKAASRLGRQASELARKLGGSLLITTSARTRPDAARALRDSLDAPSRFYEWRPDDPDNPYFSYLGLADEIIVTMDSISMLSEACATGKPVYMFNLEGAPAETDFRLGARLYRQLMRWAPDKLSRDISIIHRQLIEAGHSCWLGDKQPAQRPLPPQDAQRAVARIQRLLRERGFLSHNG